MTILLKLIKPIERLDKFLTKTKTRILSSVFLLTGGYRCTLCGSNHLHFKYPQYTGWVNNVNGTTTRMLLSWSMLDNIVCPLCAIDEIKTYFLNYNPYDKDVPHYGTCDYTGKTGVLVCPIIWGRRGGFSLRHGREWWNGFVASEEALIEAIRSSVISSSVSEYNDGKILYASGKYKVPLQTFSEWMNKQSWYN